MGLLRVVVPGGMVVAEFYNPYSLRALVKRFGPAGAISATTDESAVFTRFDRPDDVAALLPPGATIVDRRGVRIVTPAARFLQVPLLSDVLRRAEHLLCDTPLATFGGFWIAAIKKSDAS